MLHVMLVFWYCVGVAYFMCTCSVACYWSTTEVDVQPYVFVRQFFDVIVHSLVSLQIEKFGFGVNGQWIPVVRVVLLM